MTTTEQPMVELRHPNEFFVGGEWVTPSSADRIVVTDSHSERPFVSVPEARAADMDRAITAAHDAFARGPWPRMSHTERGDYLRGLADGIRVRAAEFGQILPKECG
jgi:acyl-CoA reductase-like NAD-dependent aldehyde dehydrogenase